MSRAPNALEQRIHQECLSKKNKIISKKEVEAIVPDVSARADALNFLLKTGLFVVLADKNNNLSYRAALKKEVDVKKDISGDENLVLHAFQASTNEGIWTKHLKNKTELHQTIITRCLKSLEQKQLIKSVKSVKASHCQSCAAASPETQQFPTRKLYMMAHLEPSVEVTGGPWYTDHELDTEFIRMLLAACLMFISDSSFPKSDSDARSLFPISNSPTYPSSNHVLGFLQKVRITETDLNLEHVESLLNVLVYDGLIERLPALGALSWNMNMGDPDDINDADADKKRQKSRKRKRRRDDSGDDDDSNDERRKSKKRKSKSRERASDSEEDEASSKRGKKRKGRAAASSSEEESNRDTKKRKEARKTKYKRRAEASRSSSDAETLSSPDEAEGKGSTRRDKLGEFNGAHVYRAIRREQVEALQAWAQSPCARCPQFDFCDSAGPVNPGGCEYYSQWLDCAVGERAGDATGTGSK